MELAQFVGVIITIIVSVSSLLVSILVYFQQTPRLRCEIDQSYYGPTTLNESFSDFNVMAAIDIVLQNRSPAKISIYEILLKIGREKYRYVSPFIPEGQVYSFYYKGAEGLHVSDGSCLAYSDFAWSLPTKILEYEAELTTLLFQGIPKNFKGKKSGVLIIKTTAGKIKKRVNMKPFDENTAFDLNEFKKYEDSTIVRCPWDNTLYD